MDYIISYSSSLKKAKHFLRIRWDQYPFRDFLEIVGDIMRYISKEEHDIASRYLFVDLAIRTIEVDLERLENHDLFKIKEVYVNLLERILVIGTEERRELKKLLKKENIDVVLSDKTEDFTEYTFVAKGKQEVKNYWNYHIRNRVRDIMCEWLGKINKS